VWKGVEKNDRGGEIGKKLGVKTAEFMSPNRQAVRNVLSGARHWRGCPTPQKKTHRKQ